MGSWFIVAPDMAVIRQINDYRNTLVASPDPTESLATSYIRESYGFDLSCDDEKQAEIYRTIVERMSELTGQEDPAVDYPGYTLDSKAEGRADIIALNGGLFFLGVMLGPSSSSVRCSLCTISRSRKDTRIGSVRHPDEGGDEPEGSEAEHQLPRC